MRKAGKVDFVGLTEDDTVDSLIGIVMEGDACAEHECGNRKIRELFGCDPKAPHGIPRRVIAQTSKTNWRKETICLVHYKEDEKYAILVGGDFWNFEGVEKFPSVEAMAKSFYELYLPDEPSEHELRGWHRPLCGAWDDGSFGIVVPKSKAPLLRRLKEAFDKKDIVFLMTSHFIISGFCIAIASKLPLDLLNKYRDDDISHEELIKEHERIGIEERLKKTWKPNDWQSGCRWGALSPRWVEGDNKKHTKYRVMYWLNPQDQQNNYFGWVTVEDLEDWIEGKGKIPGHGFTWEREQRRLQEEKEKAARKQKKVRSKR